MVTLMSQVLSFEDKPYCIDHCAVAYVIPEKEEEKQHVPQRV